MEVVDVECWTLLFEFDGYNVEGLLNQMSSTDICLIYFGLTNI